MYEGVVYYAGPMTLWSGTVAEGEILVRVSHRWKWVVALKTLSAYGPLDPQRCGYILKRGDRIIAHAKALDERADVDLGQGAVA